MLTRRGFLRPAQSAWLQGLLATEVSAQGRAPPACYGGASHER